jgi:soluble P-type ATPase
MIEIVIPGRAPLQLAYLVLDYNGTLAVDGDLLPGVREALSEIAHFFEIHVVTGDTFGTARTGLEGTPCRLAVLGAQDQAEAKFHYVERLEPLSCVAIGNGRNDRLMLEAAGLGIVVCQGEGAATEAIMAADVLASDITAAFALLNSPMRLTATPRS